ncbi:translation initiation factor IF-2 [Dimargaris verticillata]|uniref:Translation initiation factor IF-2, mitochondrial n=1 Tax=Dimargaris verticillata TaxID=2761393 RepID=A0A9W8AWT0_9FUNG|nr:translation initiation factor IF-2 [Dimargaris verticillata]
MGHVDHGKTTLLDYLRKSAIAAGEAGGITQHIGAFSVSLANSDQPVTFLDTPGHAAFSNMRSRGAHMTDIVVLVVAADDGVMPQTIEAIKHAQDADVPIIVAVNKCDKPQANPNRIKEMLLKHSVQVEDFGGDIQAVEISALKGDNVDALIENILTLAEVLDLRAPTDGPAEARVVESQSEKGRGMTASVLVKNGTLKVGDIIVAGTTWGKVKSMTSDLGKPVKEAGPGDPVKVAGWKELPNAGDLALQVETEALAKEIIANRAQRVKQQKALQDIRVINEKRIQHNEETQEHNAERKQYAREVYRYYRGLRKDYPLEEQYLTKPSVPDPAEVAHKQQYRGPPTLRFVVKGDVSGTITAVVDALLALPQKKVRLEVVSHGVGAIVESDIQMAKSCEAMVIGFNVKADRTVQRVAKYLKVPVETHRVIYHLIDAVKQRMLDTMEPEYDTKVIGEANIQRVFTLDLKHGQHQRVAGCRVASGSIRHNHEVQVVRSDKVLYRGKLGSLKSGKHNTSEVTKGVECGISFADFDGFEEGDQIVSIEHIERPRKLA